MLYCVKLVAENIEVTAANESQAVKYAEDDAREFASQNSYLPTETSIADPKFSEEDDPDTFNYSFEVDLQSSSDDDDDEDEDEDEDEDNSSYSWTFDASIFVYVNAESALHAEDLAKRLFATWDNGGVTPAVEPGSETIGEILEFYGQAKTCATAAHAAVMVYMAQKALMKIPHTDPAFETLSTIYDERRFDDGYELTATHRIGALAENYLPQISPTI